MTAVERVRLEVLRFMRDQYKLDELADTFYDAPRLKFRQGLFPPTARRANA